MLTLQIQAFYETLLIVDEELQKEALSAIYLWKDRIFIAVSDAFLLHGVINHRS